MAHLLRMVPREAWPRDNQVWGFGKSHLYVIQEADAGRVKVGIAGHPVRRRAALQAGNSRQLQLSAVYAEIAAGDARAAELAIGRAFERHRLAGEWLSVWPVDVQDFLARTGMVE